MHVKSWTAIAVVGLALALSPSRAEEDLVLGQTMPYSGPASALSAVGKVQTRYFQMINEKGGINGRKIKLIIEDSAYDPKRAVLATQKLVERDQIFSMVGAMGSPTVLAAQDLVLDAGITQLFPLTAAEFTFKLDPAKPQDRLKFSNLLPYVESTRAALKYMMESKHYKNPCIMYQDDEYGKNVLDGFTQQLAAMKVAPASIALSAFHSASRPRAASDRSSRSVWSVSSFSSSLATFGATAVWKSASAEPSSTIRSTADACRNRSMPTAGSSSARPRCSSVRLSITPSSSSSFVASFGRFSASAICSGVSVPTEGTHQKYWAFLINCVETAMPQLIITKATMQRRSNA